MFDSYDRHILNLLQEDGRITNLELAERVGLSSAAAWRRVKALEEAGVIRKYTALLDANKIARGLRAMLSVSLVRHMPECKQAFEDAVRSYPEVLQCFAVTGSADFMLLVAVEDMTVYDAFLNEKIFTLEGVGQAHTHFALREIKNDTVFALDARRQAGEK
ncbi:AsnC family transcriptional regulator [Pokkaliibacter plantistimulans]|uniref:AsnC family transcriptional regulator n=2 Tax=Pseudomonadota TaxID=1224 RepID=A0ABX5M656_9GAMM|nr:MULTISPECIES: Lrp/AsnC family transcriptional regulator [Pokkaliibacter]MDH2435907.1 Lrp/AsnC family transcriptional regulator [Pokkaliibacter sp. MBI-7]PPC74242.1 AsnC family transcriptional regulator [Pokkaliibacter plantistimulans]PXF33156.1 AsnC family transcriptional regulator [Pokkaliibacter plantistimulans]